MATTDTIRLPGELTRTRFTAAMATTRCSALIGRRTGASLITATTTRRRFSIGGTEVDTLNGGAGDDIIFAGYGDNVDGGDQESYGDKLFISFQAATTGIVFDFKLGTKPSAAARSPASKLSAGLREAISMTQSTCG